MGSKERKPLALIVEDDADQRHLVAALIEETDLDVLECESAEAALSVMQRCGERILLVFVDPGDRLGFLPKEAAYMDKPWRALDVLIAAEEVLASRRAAA